MACSSSFGDGVFSLTVFFSLRTGVVSVGTGVSERWRQVKSLNYLPAILARVVAKKHGGV